MCVQRFDDSLNSAIRITYRILLRSSSLREPRYPLLTVVSLLFLLASISRAQEDFSRLVVECGLKNLDLESGQAVYTVGC